MPDSAWLICSRCKYLADESLWTGDPPCLLDPAKPVPISVHVRNGCPAGHHKDAKPPPRLEPLPEPLPRHQWPRSVRILAVLRIDADAGFGDTLHRQLSIRGVDWAGKMMRWLKRHAIDCGCSQRQAWLNARFPYS
jgi:hypothetical protein